MKKFVKKILFFSLPILIGLSFIFFIKTNREFCYNYVKGDCDQRGKLLYKKMYEDKNKVDYLFVGSSKTWNDINDELLENLINIPNSYHARLFNVGYCRFGRNLDYLFCKEFLKRNPIKKIFLEVRADESTTSHPMFPYLANGKEVLEGALALNISLFPEIYNHLLMNVNYFRCKINLAKADSNKTNPFLHGYNNIEKTISPELLDKFYEKEIKQNDHISLTYRFSNYYLRKIKLLCDKKKIELNFIYLPSYANVNKTPAFLKQYEAYGKVIIAPDSIFTNKTYWKDVAHFNSFGAEAYTKFLATRLK
ncbi:MAG TPA: hypothetical protein VN026_16355 [Bacteroidia bacterium]|jgi:hypothetical protein|nr:hypothetical protein [Bacteroidia bacterium]